MGRVIWLQTLTWSFPSIKPGDFFVPEGRIICGMLLTISAVSLAYLAFKIVLAGAKIALA